MARKQRSRPTREVLWAIHNPEIGFYTQLGVTRKDTIAWHEQASNKTWKLLRKAGDRCFRVLVTRYQK